MGHALLPPFSWNNNGDSFTPYAQEIQTAKTAHISGKRVSDSDDIASCVHFHLTLIFFFLSFLSRESICVYVSLFATMIVLKEKEKRGAHCYIKRPPDTLLSIFHYIPVGT